MHVAEVTVLCISLMAIVIVPFPTTLLGANLATDHAGPAVVLYSAVDALLALGWWLFSRTALGPRPLTKNDRAAARMRRIRRDATFAIVFYTACAIAAAWWPRGMAAVITVVWGVWLVHSLKFRAEDQSRAEHSPFVGPSTMVSR